MKTYQLLSIHIFLSYFISISIAVPVLLIAYNEDNPPSLLVKIVMSLLLSFVAAFLSSRYLSKLNFSQHSSWIVSIFSISCLILLAVIAHLLDQSSIEITILIPLILGYFIGTLFLISPGKAHKHKHSHA
jgi:uncharacterized membrane protein YfcA